jgi:hypothetical protein
MLFSLGRALPDGDLYPQKLLRTGLPGFRPSCEKIRIARV